jgi:hypothetical protein
MVTTIAEVLNIWNDLGIFSYVFPALLIFAVVFAILDKSKILGDNRPVQAIVSISIALMSLMFDFVPTFFATIFPRFGIVLSIFLVLVLLGGMFYNEKENRAFFFTIGIIIGLLGIFWALGSWNYSWDNLGLGSWFNDNFWAIVIIILVGVMVWLIANKPATGSTSSTAH